MPCKDNTKEKRGTVLGKKFPSRYLCKSFTLVLSFKNTQNIKLDL